MLAELAAAVRDRRVSSEELVRRSLARIERLNPPLNAVISTRAELALEEAAAVDARVGAGEDPGSLAGIPVLIKDMEAVAGVPTTYGSVAFADAAPAAADGLIPRRLRAAGAVIVGKTNQPEFACAGFTDNLLYGPTRNPWNLERSPGGSSGGSGAAMAAGMVPIATATDGGGSIRIPAGFCGLAGLKPTAGVIGREPIPEWIDLSTFGPLATSIADLRLLLDVESGPTQGDPTALPSPIPMRDEMPRRALAAPRLVEFGPLPEGVRAVFDQALQSVERDLGLPIEPIEPSEIFRSGDPSEDWYPTCSAEHMSHLGWDFLNENLDRFSPYFRGWVESARKVTLDEYLAMRRRRFEYVRELDLLLGDDTVLLTPTNAIEGMRPDGINPDTGAVPESDGFNTDPQNITGHPAVSVPAGVSPNGVPFGLQITAPRFRDDMALAVADAWERANPWPLVAPGFEPFDV
jgi:Asp-tRNA(Asn)/Glu-tRNA(Gln) amidotransferase A subunit family amidase